MPRYYFHTETGRTSRDTDGMDMPDAEAAKIDAVRVLGELLRDAPVEFWSCGHFAVIVDGDDGTSFHLRAMAEP